MSLAGPARTLVKPIIALYSPNQVPANLRHANSANYVGCSWLAEMHWLDETDNRPADRSMGAVCLGLGDRAGRDVSYQPFRLVRPASGLVTPSWKAVHASVLSHSMAL